MPFPDLEHVFDLEKLREGAAHIEGDIEVIRHFLDDKSGWMHDESVKRIAFLETVLTKVRRRIAELENPAGKSPRLYNKP